MTGTSHKTQTSVQARPHLLLFEPHFVVRRTVVFAARDLDLADIEEAASHSVALDLLSRYNYSGLIIATDADGAGLALLREVREGKTRSSKDVAIVVLADSVNPKHAEALRDLGVQRLILKPAKVKTILETIAMLALNKAGESTVAENSDRVALALAGRS